MNDIVAAGNFELFEPSKLESIVRAADMLSRSGVIPVHLAGKKESVFAILVMGHELGMSAMQSLMNIHVISGRPTQAAQLLLARVYQRFPTAYVKFETDREKQVVRCYGARPGKDKAEAYCAEWDVPRAAAMGLTTKDNYRKQLITMLTARAAAEMVRYEFPDVAMGLYATEEFQDTTEKTLVHIQPDDGDEHLDPRTEIQKEVGNPEYIIAHAKYRMKALKDIDPEELADYADTIAERMQRDPTKSPWQNEVLTSIRLYLRSLDS